MRGTRGKVGGRWLWLACAGALCACTERPAPKPAPDGPQVAAAQAAGPQRPSATGAGAPAATPDAFDQLLRLLDTDRDGRISADEHRRGARDMFRRMDRDGDGKVTVEEMDAVRRGLDDAEGASRDRLREVDRDGDGVLGEEEHLAATRVVFDASDANGDGHLERSEPVRAQRPGGG
jgi:Ca2+-binding EF-hand superfamily protein